MSFDFITFIRDKTGFGNADYALDVRAVQVVGGDSYITINGEPVVTGGGGGGANWSEYPATQNVTVTGYNLDVDAITGLGGIQMELSATEIDGATVLTVSGNPITSSQILYGSIPPGLTAGVANDTYINTTNGDVYSKVSSTEWISSSSLSLPWTSITSNSTGQFLAACVQNQQIWTSDDYGVNWFETNAPSAYWTSIVSDSSGAKLVACASGGKIWLSFNYGASWSEADVPALAWSSVASDSNGQILLACVEGGSIYFSTNAGESWSESSAPSLGWTSVASNSNGSVCVACASGGKIWTSINFGSDWTETTSPVSNWRSITSSSGQFLAACTSYGTIWRSVDGGLNWTETGSPPQEWSSIKCTPDESKLIATVQSGGIWTSIDAGVTWIESDAPFLIWTSVTTDSTGTKLLACASGGKIYTNSGGWTLELNITGPTGPAGPAGVTGATGADGQSSSYFDYQADNGVNPTTGHITWSNFTQQILSTYIRVNHINQDGVDIDIFLNLIQQGNTLIIQDANVSANYQRWLVSGTPIPNTGAGYVQYPVTLSTSGGSSNFANNHAIILATIVPGPAGPAGPAGPTGATGPMNPGLYNKLQIVPVATPTPSTVIWSGLTGPPNSWVWDPSTASPTSGTGNSWRFSKTALQTTSISWSMFTQAASIQSPWPVPSPSIPKNTLEAVYFLITPTINIVNTSSPAVNMLSLNIYSYSATGTPNFYNTRWGYNILGTGTTLFAGYTYLLYALDVPRTTTGNGTSVPATQTTFLRDPYDIYTNLPHIGMQNVITAGSTTAGYDSVPITLVAITSTNALVTGGVDFIITKCGYKVGGTNVEYTLNFT